MENKSTLSDRYKKYIKDKKSSSQKIDASKVDKIAKILCPSDDEIQEELNFLTRRR